MERWAIRCKECGHLTIPTPELLERIRAGLDASSSEPVESVLERAAHRLTCQSCGSRSATIVSGLGLSAEAPPQAESETLLTNANFDRGDSKDVGIIGAAITLASFGGLEIADGDRVLLHSEGSGLGPSQKARLAEIVQAALNGFFHAAAKGHVFCDPDRIRQRFGRNLGENYPDAGPAFLRFAETYWTLKLTIDDPRFDVARSLAHALLAEVEGNIGALFFPTPGPITIDPAKRETAQREILMASGAPINIQEFISQNPILLRDKVGGRTGCLGSVVLALAAFGIITAALLGLIT